MDSGLVKKAKDLLGHHAFGNDPVKGVSQDYNKPLFVPAYSDAFQTIMGQEAAGGGRISLDMWKHQYTTHFPQTVNKITITPMCSCAIFLLLAQCVFFVSMETK